VRPIVALPLAILIAAVFSLELYNKLTESGFTASAFEDCLVIGRYGLWAICLVFFILKSRWTRLSILIHVIIYLGFCLFEIITHRDSFFSIFTNSVAAVVINGLWYLIAPPFKLHTEIIKQDHKISHDNR
jgi:hypothetical protein